MREKAIEIVSKSKLYSGIMTTEDALISLIEEALIETRDLALEEAAKMLDAWSTPMIDKPNETRARLWCGSFARDIRALKSAKGEL